MQERSRHPPLGALRFKSATRVVIFILISILFIFLVLQAFSQRMNPRMGKASAHPTDATVETQGAHLKVPGRKQDASVRSAEGVAALLDLQNNPLPIEHPNGR